MHTSNGRSYLIEDVASFFFWNIMPINNDVKEFFSFTIICKDEHLIALFEYFIDF